MLLAFLIASSLMPLSLIGGAQTTPTVSNETAPPSEPVTTSAIAPRAELERLLVELRAELDEQRRAFELREAALRAEVEELKRELGRALDERLAREREWLRYSKALQGARPEGLRFDPILPDNEADVRESSVEVASSTGGNALAIDAGAEPAGGSVRSPAQDGAGDVIGDAADDAATAAAVAAETARAARDRAVLIALRSLFIAEEIGGLDLLEIGTLGDGWTGPVVMRVLGEWGHPLGSITAERMRLEGSRAARTLTLVLEVGYERRMGDRIPFRGPGGENVRRIVLPHVDPAPWIEDLPELFDEASLGPAPDDGRWDLGDVRAALNELLRLDAASGWYRVRVLGGVQGKLLRNVMLEHLDADGRLERRLFADRVEVVPQDRGLMLLLEGGAQERGGRKTPFLEGRYRIFLPRAELARWTEAGIPGLSEQPERGTGRGR